MSACAASQEHPSSQKTTPSRLPAFLYRRGRWYCFKRKVPADCRELFCGRKQVWKSLGTDLLERAKVMLAVEVTEFDLAVARHRKDLAARAARSGDARSDEDRPRQNIALASRTSGSSLANPQALLQGIETSLQHLRALLDATAERAALRPNVELLMASDGAAGLKLTAERCPDLLLLDMSLPDMAGLDLLRRLRQLPALARVPCIAVSANAMPEEIARARAQGVDEYLTKPLEVHVLLGKVDQVLQREQRSSAV